MRGDVPLLMVLGVESNTTSGYFILTRCGLEGTSYFGLNYRPSSGHKIYLRKLSLGKSYDLMIACNEGRNT
jgi:hypothetical protein